jgi:glycine cleavage system H protein
MPVDIFATKGTEYLLTVVYFALLIALVRYLAPRPGRRTRASASRAGDAAPALAGPADRWFHPGHAWVAVEHDETGLVTVGLDDFTAQVVGAPDRLALPPVGAHVRQGGPGWELSAGGRTLGMVSPVEGEVVAVNEAVSRSPRLATEDPYGAGWLLKLRAPRRQLWQRNLLGADLAALWMRHSAERLRERLAGEGREAMAADGGTPAPGFGRALAPEEWDGIAREFFLNG